MSRSSFQAGSVVRVPRKSGDVWRYRWREGTVQRSEHIGSVKLLPSKAQAEKAAGRFRKHVNTDIEVITVSDLIAKFWKESPPERETTAHSYRSIFKRIEAEYGSLRVDALAREAMAIEQWLKELRVIGRHPKPGAKPLVSNLYRSQVRNLLHLLFEKAMLWGCLQVDRNPIALIRLKGSSQRAKELVILNAVQLEQLLDDEQLPKLVKVMIQLMSGLGLRVSEALGLRWTDIDFDARTVKIQRSMVHGQANDTKTQSSNATLPLHDNLIEVLRYWRLEGSAKDKWVFTSERTQLPYDRDWLRSEYLQPAGERIGMPGLGWHSLRHGYRAMMRVAGIDMETQRGLMRHARIATTINTYGGDDNAERVRPANAKVIEMLPRRSA